MLRARRRALLLRCRRLRRRGHLDAPDVHVDFGGLGLARRSAPTARRPAAAASAGAIAGGGAGCSCDLVEQAVGGVGSSCKVVRGALVVATRASARRGVGVRFDVAARVSRCGGLDGPASTTARLRMTLASANSTCAGVAVASSCAATAALIGESRVAVSPARLRRRAGSSPAPARAHSPPDGSAVRRCGSAHPCAWPASRCSSPLTPAPAPDRRARARLGQLEDLALAPAIRACERVHFVEQAPRAHVDFFPEKRADVEAARSRRASHAGQHGSSARSSAGIGASSARFDFRSRARRSTPRRRRRTRSLSSRRAALQSHPARRRRRRDRARSAGAMRDPRPSCARPLPSARSRHALEQ